MQTTIEQPNFFSLFDQPSPTAEIERTATIAPTATAASTPSFVTERQRELMRASPYASFVRGKTLEEIKAIDDDFGNKLYKKRDTADGERRLELWRNTVSSARTIALEIEYKKIDERFCSPEKGIILLIGKHGEKTTVSYKFSPYYFDRDGGRTHTPVHHLEFKSETPTEISETGYRSHFFGFVPYAHVRNFADFMIQMLRIHLNVTAPIVLEGQRYEFDASILPTKTKPKNRKCPECSFKMKADECPNCGYFDGADEEDFDEDFEDD